MTRRQELVIVVLLTSWVAGCVRQGIKAKESMADEVAMAKFEREFLPTLVERDEIYSEARGKWKEYYGFPEELSNDKEIPRQRVHRKDHSRRRLRPGSESAAS